ncbi:DUF1330 domain-containing protein [Massilia sp.]|uniref:DUF1330 domain-containing protein n=1 Tax=Massilia sp. TaxID=1882437 RepID=UPI00352F64DC
MTLRKGYWVIQCQDITDPAAMQEYADAWGAIAAEFGAAVIAGGGQLEVAEGATATRVLIVAFPSFRLAQDCYHSKQYQRAKIAALQAMARSLSIVEGA